MIKVGINGFGTVGKRVADAISLQDDMIVSGVTLTRPSFKAESAMRLGYKLYSAIPGEKENLKDFDVQGDIRNLCKVSDVIIDASPENGSENMKLYKEMGIKAIFQGGEDHQLTGTSFSALANFDEAKNKDYVRVVSCNTTGLCRILSVLEKDFGVDKVYAVLVRRSADPHDSKKGPINAIVPETAMPSHHGPDVKSVIPSIDIVTTAVKVPTTIMHMHVLTVDLKKNVKKEDVIKTLEKSPRIKIVEKGMGMKSTAEVMELAKDMGRKRGDLFEVAVWKDSINVLDGKLYLMQAIHQEADIVPENVDAVRSMFNLCSKEESIRKTNEAMGIE